MYLTGIGHQMMKRKTFLIFSVQNDSSLLLGFEKDLFHTFYSSNFPMSFLLVVCPLVALPSLKSKHHEAHFLENQHLFLNEQFAFQFFFLLLFDFTFLDV